MVNLTEKQAGRVDVLLKFRFAKENKSQPFSAKRSLSPPRRIERASDFSGQISQLPFSSTFESDRLLARINKLPPIGLPFSVPIRIWEPNETNFADG